MPPTLADYAATSARRPAPPSAPIVTLVTVCLNAAKTIGRTIDSVQAQTFPGIEHVVVDACSTDGTVELLRERLRPQDFLLSEKDKGISDAFNKGVALARGRYIQFINADDWLEPDQVAKAVAAIEASGADFVFGDLLFYQGGRPTFRYRGDGNYARTIAKVMPALNHPTVLARKSAFQRVGLFDPGYRCAMDYDWFLRLHRAGGKGAYVPGILGHMTHDGVSNTQYLRTIEEVRRIAIAHGRPAALATAEAMARRLKTGLGQQVKAKAFPLYQLVRQGINRNYQRV